MAFEARNLSDGFGRRFSYVRLSVTEVCNFRCTYCLPDGWKKTGPLSFLTPAETANLTAAFAEVGVSKIRLTGESPAFGRIWPRSSRIWRRWRALQRSP
ncbi:MAG: hypothetical protein NVV72_09940 [Asticcacaulis sp.]|nr:hypothetical protein [Asticcacaulis sp.]